MANALNAKLDLIEHVKSDEMWVDENRRRCPRCEEVKTLTHFRPSTSSSNPFYRDPQGKVTWLCQACRGEEWNTAMEVHKSIAEESRAKAVTELAKVISKGTKRTLLEDAAPTAAAGLRKLIDAAGGEDEIWRVGGESLKKIISEGKFDQRLAAIRSVMNFTVQTNKLQGTPIDLSSIPDEELLALLIEPAKHLLLTDENFRKELLSDPDVHALLLQDAGVQLIEA